MLIVIMIIATLLVTVWLVLLARVTDDDCRQAAEARLFDNLAAIAETDVKERAGADIAVLNSGFAAGFVKKLINRNIARKKAMLNRQAGQLQDGNYKCLNILIMPGYVLQRERESIGKSSFRKNVLQKSSELYGRKYAGCKTSELMAKMLSYPVIGIAAALILGLVLLAAGITSAGIGVIAVGTGLVSVLTYGQYDELCDRVNKRRKAISRQFPNVISKLALLVTSGMIMDRAWKETANSQEAEIYAEMRKTSEELDNLVSPEAAFGNFINRCNTKETAKLASAILQNRSKGNAEIGRLLKDMAREAWQERRHNAKRDAEKANSKLMIPTMLLLLAILVMLMVPIAMNFAGI